MARVRAEQAVQRWYADKMTLVDVTFPIYAAEGWPARINGSGSHGDDLTHLTIAHAETLPDPTVVQRPRIEISTSVDPHQPGELAIARQAFASGIEADTNRPSPMVSPTPPPRSGSAPPAAAAWPVLTGPLSARPRSRSTAHAPRF